MPDRLSPSHSRRAVVAALVAAPALWLGPRAQPVLPRRATPGQTEGPFYPLELPPDSDFDLLRNGALVYGRGQPSWIEGVVTDLKYVQGAPGNARDSVWRSLRDDADRAAVTVKFSPVADDLQANFPIVVAV
jgi:protocatechuate 3,4-dioxygenase beta subunit